MEIRKNGWYNILKNEFTKDYFLTLTQYLSEECDTFNTYPDQSEIFTCLNLTDYHDVKVVILGQDPYHGKGQAHGLSFSVKRGVKIPPSLMNIYKELHNDLGCEIPTHGNLEYWAQQGVLLLNTVLTVEQGKPNSHKGIGWELFTDEVIRRLNEREKPVIFILWGNHAGSKSKLISNKHHYVITSPHPSPFSAYKGFFGSKPFSRANEILSDLNQIEIDWQIPIR